MKRACQYTAAPLSMIVLDGVRALARALVAKTGNHFSQTPIPVLVRALVAKTSNHFSQTRLAHPRLICWILLTALCLQVLFESAASADDKQVVNVYSSRHYDTDLALYKEFTARTGITVNRLEAKADALLARIRTEGAFSPADVFITTDAGRLWHAENAGLLAPLTSDLLAARLPDHLRHPHDLWFGLSKRARIIIYNKAAGRPAQLDTYQDLANPIHKGKVCIRSSSNIYNISLMASLIAHDGAHAAERWANGVVANFARRPQGNDTAQIYAVASGECQIAVVNTYYLARLAASQDKKAQAAFSSIELLFPNQDSTGTHINISGAGLMKHAPNKENAILFIEYLTENTAQQYFANSNHEYPAVENVATSTAIEALGNFREDSLPLSILGVNQAEAMQIFDRAGWR